MKINSIIISAFPMSGKTLNSATYNLQAYAQVYEFDNALKEISFSKHAWLDKEKKITNPDFPKNYVDEVEMYTGNTFLILISSSKKVRAEMQRRNINYHLIYPDKSRKNELLKNAIKNPERSEEFCNWLDNKFESAIEHIESDTFARKLKLNNEGEFTIKFPDILEWAIRPKEQYEELSSSLTNLIQKNKEK